VALVEGLLAAYDQQARRESANLPPGVWCERDGPVVRVVGRHEGFISTPCDVGVGGADLDRLIARQRDYFARRGEAVEWKTWAYDQPADLTGRLAAAGFVPGEPETVVIGLASQMATDPVLPEGVVLSQVTEPAGIDRIAEMEAKAWGHDSSGVASDLIGEMAAAPDDIVVFAAEAAGVIVCAGRIEFRPGTEFAGLWGGATLPEWRGKGIYRALVARRAQLAVARGVRYLQVDASADSAPILQRLGFVAVTTTTPYVWSPET
jgi:GNAT superfamily N-acetyltransferase